MVPLARAHRTVHVLGLGCAAALGLRLHLVRAAEEVEIVHVEAAEEGLQREETPRRAGTPSAFTLSRST